MMRETSKTAAWFAARTLPTSGSPAFDASQTADDNHAQEFADDEHRLPFDVKEE
jgi:hypothetical protein